MSEPLDLEILANMSDSQLLNEGRDMILAEVHRLRTPSPVGTAPIEAARPEVDLGEIEDILYDLISELNGLEDNEDAAEAAITEAAKALAALLPSPALDWTDPGHRLTESELDAAVKLYHDTRRGRNGFATTDRAALEAVIRGFLASNRAPPTRIHPQAGGRNVKEYQIARGPFNISFNTLVQKFLDEGWQLQGGVSVDQEDYVYQAMTREKPEPGASGESNPQGAG